MVEQTLRSQLDVGDGPMLHALSTSSTVHVTDPATETRWPLWSRFVADLPIGSVLHVPLTTSAGSIGVVSLYHDRCHAFSHADEAIAHLLARHAAIAVASERCTSELVAEMDARKLTGQAMGILMEHFGLTSDQAIATLRRYSQETNTKLRDVALGLIEDRVRRD